MSYFAAAAAAVVVFVVAAAAAEVELALQALCSSHLSSGTGFQSVVYLLQSLR